MPIPKEQALQLPIEEQMVHTYRNRQRNGRLLRDAGLSLLLLAVSLFIGWPPSLLDGSPLTFDVAFFLVFCSVFILCAAFSLYAAFFRRYYEIRLSDKGACEFRAPLRSKHLQAQQIISVQRNAKNTVRSEGDEAEHTVLRYKRGRLVVVQPVDGFGDFLTRLEALNPVVDVRGTEPEVSEPPRA